MSRVTQNQLIEANNKLFLAIITERKLHERTHHGPFGVDEAHYKIRKANEETAECLDAANRDAAKKFRAICDYLGITLEYRPAETTSTPAHYEVKKKAAVK